MEEGMAGGSEPDQAPADQRQLVDRDPLAELGVRERGQRRVRVRRVAQVLQVELDRERLVDLGGPASVPAGEGGPVDLVARDDLAERPLERARRRGPRAAR